MAVFADKSTKQVIYELLMLGLAAFSVATIWQQNEYDSYIVWGTWSIFFVDFIYRFYNSSKKWDFIKKNPFIVIAAIPLDAIFQFARFARILHLLRLKSITKYYTMPFIKFLKRQHLSYVMGLTAIITFILIIPMKNIEDNLNSYPETLWHSLRALTFFGRAGFEPETIVGHVIVVVFTIFGVILHGLILSIAINFIMEITFIKNLTSKWKGETKDKKCHNNES
ncbi:hypothetical protein LF817_02280 [Halobacillus sp. A1]|uniref:hypothetical protein n=1 Tax=Halobacillus sp. A1 TaxID=2880262 RepID=UPI0020A6BF75|nr:hypothetical protein [Halobacillus sp. A1]MCP3030164.1 hypothetical protein [Halobacillus sp. A1]